MDFEKTVRSILKEMDVNQDRDDAESKAIEIYKFGPQALDILIDLAHQTLESGLEGQDRRKYMRAIIFSAAVFAEKDKKFLGRSETHDNAMDLLYTLAAKGFQSAVTALNRMNVSFADIYKKMLLSLPLSEKHSRDKEVSLSEAVEEIKTWSDLPGPKGITADHYDLGQDEKSRLELYRIGKSLFGVRARKKK